MLTGEKNLFADLFKDDFPGPKALEAELALWETYWLESEDCLPDNISSTLKHIPFNGFNNISFDNINKFPQEFLALPR